MTNDTDSTFSAWACITCTPRVIEWPARPMLQRLQRLLVSLWPVNRIKFRREMFLHLRWFSKGPWWTKRKWEPSFSSGQTGKNYNLKRLSRKYSSDPVDISKFEYTYYSVRCVHYGDARSRGKGLRPNQRHFSMGCCYSLPMWNAWVSTKVCCNWKLNTYVGGKCSMIVHLFLLLTQLVAKKMWK